jgi:hypothetical protein
MNQIKDYLSKVGKRGGLTTKKRGRDYYKQIGKLGLAKRYKKSIPPEKISSKGLTLLMVPVPPMLEKVIGYNGEARFVSFYWTPAGDEAYYDDGQRASTGEWQGYLSYIQHPTVHPLLSPYHLGSSDSEAQHALILDRQERKLYAASIKEAGAFLSQQWPKLKPTITQEEYLQLVTQALKNVQFREPDMKEIHRRIEEQFALVEALQHWLNQFLSN